MFYKSLQREGHAVCTIIVMMLVTCVYPAHLVDRDDTRKCCSECLSFTSATDALRCAYGVIIVFVGGIADGTPLSHAALVLIITLQIMQNVSELPTMD